MNRCWLNAYLISVAAILALMSAGRIGADGEGARDAAGQRIYRILPIGDSITEGGKTFSTYRYPLREKLFAAGYLIEYIGSRSSESRIGPLPHEGYGGKNAEFLAATVGKIPREHAPDIALIHAGHNHTVEEQPINGIVSATEKIIASLRAENPKVIVLLAQVIPSGKLPKYSYIPALNEELGKLAERLNTPPQPVIIVNQAAGFDWSADTIADMVHPNAKGAEKMAAQWFAALTQVMEKPGQSTARSEVRLPITVVNYSKLPVHAAAVALDEKDFHAKLGLPENAPIRIRAANKDSAMPISRGTADGRPVLWLYVSLPPSSRMELLAEKSDRWQEAKVADAKPEEVRNGILRFAFGKKGWRLEFEKEKTGLIEDGALDFWIDNQNRGRITNGDASYLKQLGLARFADAPVEKREASVSPDGRPSIKITRRLDGVAKGMTITETFELVPGLPILICRVRWTNDSDAPLWVAYTGSGNGVFGKWSKELMPTPLIERKKSPIQGDINGGETRPAWIGQLCRISMESPATGCGVGMSTLLPTPGKVGQGSMIWGCGAGGFQCNFIDPVQGQFPFLVKPHESLENGFAFLAAQTGASVFRQTVELWQSLQKEQIPRLNPPCAVFLGGQPLYAQTVSELGAISDRQLALRMDFNKHYECRVSLANAGAANAAKIVARPMASGKAAVTLLETSQPGEHTIDLNQRLGWADEVPFVLEMAAAATISIAETLPMTPTMLSPVADASFTDFATMFRWRAIPLVVDYDLQWSRSEDFAAPQQERVTTSQDYPWYMAPDDKLPAPGKWFWRVRGAKGDLKGAWSPVRSFTVNNDYSMKPLKRPLTPEAPLFTLEASRVTDFTDFHPDAPAELAPYIGIIAEGMEGKGIPVIDFARGLDKLPHAIMLRSHWVSLADIEWLFQNVPNFIGIQGGEHLGDLYQDGKDGAMRYAHRLTRICAKYGMIYQEADGTYKDDKWQDLMDKQGAFVREYGRYLVLSQKNNIIRRQFYSQSAAMGLWLGGITHQHGAWEDGGFYWQNAGFNGMGVCAGERSGVLKTMPRIFWTLNFVMGVSRGCGIYSLDGQTLMYSPKEAERFGGAWPSAIWDTTGKTSDCFKRFVVPLIRGAVQHRLIPTKEQVLQNIKMAVYNDKKTQGDSVAWPHYVEYGPLYAATYGFGKMGNIDGQLWEFFPNTGRYYYIPTLPQRNEPINAAIKNLPVSELQTIEQVKKFFDSAYPKWYDGDATVALVGDTITILNGNENMDLTQTYSIPLNRDAFKTLSGKIGPHTYLVGKLEDQGKRLWLQANTEYPDRDTELSIICARKPQWTIEPPSATKEATWNEASKTLKLRLMHQQGVVDVTLKAAEGS
ncbi:MAG: GDSL-type esterase/lipase family protein [Candidatus Sumerlaeota bacterium]|nr:GDSL-type esterase/lipase family protein [Candidatus Sumerlaeota bacterium]